MKTACFTILLVVPATLKKTNTAQKTEQTLLDLPESQNLQTGGIESISKDESIVAVKAFT